MKILIIYELNNREFDNCVLLKYELERRGHTVHIRNKYYDLGFNYSDWYVLIPNCYSSNDLKYYMYRFNLDKKKIIVYPCEQMVNRVMPDIFYDDKNNEALELPTITWGADFFDWIKSLGYRNVNNKIVGAIHLDYCREIFDGFYDSRESMAKLYKLDLSKKWILFVSDFVLQNSDMANLAIGIDESKRERIFKTIKYEDRIQKELLMWFSEYLDNNDDSIIIYRKHPVEIKSHEIYDFEKKYQNRFVEISELNIKQWFKVCDKLCTYNSTSYIESYVSGKRMLLLRPEDFPEDSILIEYPFFKKVKKIRNYSEFLIELNNIDGEKTQNKDLEYFYCIDNTPTFVKISNYIEEFSINNISAKKCCLDKKERLRLLLKNNDVGKYCAKHFYVFSHSLFNLDKSEETLMAKKEWIASNLNSKSQKERLKRIALVLENK